MKRLLTTLGLIGVLGLGVGVSWVVAAPRTSSGSPSTGQIGICHHTGNSQAHEFIYITPDASGVFDGHGTLKHQFGQDIIPAFSFVNPQGDTVSFPGLNLTTLYDGVSGADLLSNGCQPPGTTTTTTTTGHTTTTTPTTTTGHTTTTTPTTTTSPHTTTTTTTGHTTTTTPTTTTSPHTTTTSPHTTTETTTTSPHTTTTTHTTTTDHTTTDHTTTTH